MSELSDAINAFLKKYPDDAVLEWRDKPRRKPDALTVMVGDLVEAGERYRRIHPTHPPTPHGEALRAGEGS